MKDSAAAFHETHIWTTTEKAFGDSLSFNS